MQLQLHNKWHILPNEKNVYLETTHSIHSKIHTQYITKFAKQHTRFKYSTIEDGNERTNICPPDATPVTQQSDTYYQIKKFTDLPQSKNN